MGQLNLDVFITIPGVLKLPSLLLGLVTMILGIDTYIHMHGYATEIFLLAVVILLFILSFIGLLLFIFVIEESDTSMKVDLAYHAIGGLLLITAAGVWFYSVHTHRNEGEKEAEDSYNMRVREAMENGETNEFDFPRKPHVETHDNIERIVTGVFGVTTGLLYVAIGVLLWVFKK